MVSLAASLPCSLDGMVANVRQLCPHERIEFFERLLRDCSFMEIRFVASLVENILSANYGSLGSLEDELPLLLGNTEKLLSFGDKLHLDDQRRQLIVILCLLKSRERLEVTKIIADIFQKLPDAVRKMCNSSSLTVLAAHEILLLFSLAMCHPAFEFSQKYNFYTALQSVVDLLRPALGDGDKESCILLKPSFNDLVSQGVTTSDEKVDTSKSFKITPDEDIAFIHVDIPVTSSPNGAQPTSGLKSVTVRTEKLVHVYAEKCVQQPSNPKTDPNSVLLKAKDGTRESVLHSALNAIVSEGGLPKLLEMFPPDAKAQMAEERLRRAAAKQDCIEVGNSCSPDSDFIINENNSPDNTSGLALTSGSSASSLRGSFDKKSAKADLSRSTGISSGSSAAASGLPNGADSRSNDYAQSRDANGRKLAPSAPPSLGFGSSMSNDDSPSSASSSSDWNVGAAKNVSGKYIRADDASSSSSVDGYSKQPSVSNSASDTTITNEHSGMKTNGARMPPYDFVHPIPMTAPPTDPKAFALYLQWAQAYGMLGIPPHPAGPFLWPNPHMIDPVTHHSQPSPFLVPYPIAQQQHLPLDHNLLTNRSVPTARVVQGNPVQTSTPTPRSDVATPGNMECPEKPSQGSVDGSNSQGTETNGDSSKQNLLKEEHSQVLAQSDNAVPTGDTPPPSSALASSSENCSSTTATVSAASAVNHSNRASSVPFGPHQVPPHQLQLTSAGPMGMSLPNLFTPVHLVPCNQPAQVPANQTSNAGSRRGSVASESGLPSIDPAQFSYFLYPPVLTPNSVSHIQHPSTTSSSSFIGQRNNMAQMPHFTNPPPSLNGVYQSAANTASRNKTPVSMQSNLPQVTVHSVSPAQLFSIPPPPLPVNISQKSSAATATTTSSATTAAPHHVSSGNVGPVPVPFIALSNRDLHHALAFPAAFIAPHQVDSFSPPPAPVSPKGSSNANSNNGGNIQANSLGYRANGDNMRGQPQFPGQNSNAAASRRGLTGFANVHYHQRIGQQSNAIGHLHQSQSVGAMPRPPANVNRGVTVNCFRCGEPGHVQTQCQQAVSRRRTPYSGREFHINAVPLSTNNSSNDSQQQDPRMPLSHFVQRQQQQAASGADASKAQPTTAGKSEVGVEALLPSVVVTTDSPAVSANPVTVV